MLTATSGAVTVEVHTNGRQQSPVVIYTAERTLVVDVANLAKATDRERLLDKIETYYWEDVAKALESVAVTVATEPPRAPEKPEPALGFETLEPWPDPVNGVDLLDEMAGVFRTYLSLPNGADATLALWSLGAHCIEAFTIFPFLALKSPVRQCGKTRTMEVISCLTPRPWPVVDPSNAVLFRAIEKYRPTLLLDEMDNLDFKKRGDLMALLNGSHSKNTAWVPRCEGDDFAIRNFSTWAPKVFAGIGELPDTVASRSVVIPLERQTGRRAARAIPR